MWHSTTNGIPHPDRPGWLVPPWPANASFGDVVDHFQRHNLWTETNRTHLRAYFEGYRVALETAPPDDHACPARRQWMSDMRDCVDRCAKNYGNL